MRLSKEKARNEKEREKERTGVGELTQAKLPGPSLAVGITVVAAELRSHPQPQRRGVRELEEMLRGWRSLQCGERPAPSVWAA